MDFNTQSSTNIAFRCVCCGAIISAKVNPFMMRGGFNLKCTECGKSTLSLSLDRENRVRLTVPCLFCPHPHPYTVAAETFFSKDIFLLSCSFSGMDICFIGTDEDKIEDEIDRTESLIMDLVADMKDDEEEMKQSDMLVADTNVVREVLFALDQLMTEGKLKCSCGSRAVKVVIDYDTVGLICKVCGKRRDLPARTRFDANDAIDLEELTL